MSIIDNSLEMQEAQAKVGRLTEDQLRDDLVWWTTRQSDHSLEVARLADLQHAARVLWQEAATWVALTGDELAKRRRRA